MGRGTGLGEEARDSARRETGSTTPVRSKSRTPPRHVPTRPCLPVLPAQGGTLSYRPVPPVDDKTPSAGGASKRSRLASTCSKTARSGKVSRRPSGPPSWRRPGGFRASLPGVGFVPAVRRRAVQSGDPRISRDNGRREEGRPTGGRRRSSGQRGLGVGERGARGRASRSFEGG